MTIRSESEDRLSTDILNELIHELQLRGVNFVRAVDISKLPAIQNRGYSIALLIGIALSPEVIFRASESYKTGHTEFSEMELLTDNLAEWADDFITTKGFKARAQSERNLIADGLFDEVLKTTPLPHKTIGLMAGMGWIGKNNLLVTPQYGSALCMCTVLTNAPFPAENRSIQMPECGDCTVCMDACTVKAIHGSVWETGIDRDLMVDVYHCICCLKCMTACPWSQR